MLGRASNAVEVLYLVGERRILAFDVGDGDAVVAKTGVAGVVVLAFRCSSLCSPVWLGVALEQWGCERCFLLPGGGMA